MPAGLYLINENTAETIAKVLKTNLSSDQTLIEANPGIGFLTKHLIKETKNDLQLFEPIEEFHNDLAVSSSLKKIHSISFMFNFRISSASNQKAIQSSSTSICPLFGKLHFLTPLTRVIESI